MQANLRSTTDFRLSRLTVFAFLWGNIRFFHQLSFPNWLEGRDPRDWGLFLLAGLVMLFPRWIPGLVMLLGISLLHTIAWMPFNPNHILFEFFSDLAILGGLLISLARRGLLGRIVKPLSFEEAESVFDDFVPVARFNILFLYFYAVLHKLNWDYLNLDTGCGTVLLQGELDFWIPGYQLPYLGKVMATYGTLLAEAAIPLSFLFRRTRPYGVLFGMIFHLLLSLHPHGGIFSFTALVYSYFYLFLSPDFTERLGKTLSRYFNPIRSDRRSLAIITVAFWIVLFAGLFIFGWTREDLGSFEVAIGGKAQVSQGNRFPKIFMGTFWVFLAWCVLLVTLFFLANGLKEQEKSIGRNSFIPKPAILLGSTVLVILNGLSPYLGWKTHTSFSMFSNIRTEGGVNNHLFMPRATFSPWQDDLVTVRSTNASNLKMYMYPSLELVYFEFRHLASIQKGDFYVEYIRNGEHERFEKKDSQVFGNPELAKPQSWLARKSLRFRPIYPRPCPCQH